MLVENITYTPVILSAGLKCANSSALASAKSWAVFFKTNSISTSKSPFFSSSSWCLRTNINRKVIIYVTHRAYISFSCLTSWSDFKLRSYSTSDKYLLNFVSSSFIEGVTIGFRSKHTAVMRSHFSTAAAELSERVHYSKSIIKRMSIPFLRITL